MQELIQTISLVIIATVLVYEHLPFMKAIIFKFRSIKKSFDLKAKLMRVRNKIRVKFWK
jgi:hypothetical protein